MKFNLSNRKGESICILFILLISQILMGVYQTRTDNDNILIDPMYLPIVIASFCLGFKYGLFLSLTGGLMLFSCFKFSTEKIFPDFLINTFLRVIFYLFTAFIFGGLKKELEKFTNKKHKSFSLDNFTGLKNRTALAKDIQKLRNHKEKRAYSFLLMEIDNQDELMSSFGFDFMDKLNKALVKKIKKSFGIEKIYLIRLNTIGLIYQDHFRLSKGIIDLLEEPISVDGISIYCDMIFGETTQKQDQLNLDDLLRESTVALSEARRYEKRYMKYETSLQISDTPIILGVFQKALASKLIDFHYQPIINKKFMVDSLEALIRWNHPEMGIVSPGKYIKELEYTRLANSLTYYSLEVNLPRVKQLLIQNPNLSLAINISITNLHQPDFSSRVKNYIDLNHLDPDHLKLEITERKFLLDEKDSLNNLKNLIKTGIRISIDDFGVGYTSINNFRQFEIDALKIDRTFIKNIHTDLKNQSIIKGVLMMAKELGIKTIAEGIETKDEFQKARDMGFDLFQGYYICKPLNYNDIREWLSRRRKNPAHFQ